MGCVCAPNNHSLHYKEEIIIRRRERREGEGGREEERRGGTQEGVGALTSSFKEMMSSKWAWYI